MKSRMSKVAKKDTDPRHAMHRRHAQQLRKLADQHEVMGVGGAGDHHNTIAAHYRAAADAHEKGAGRG